MILATLMLLAAQDAPKIEEAPDAPPGSTVTKPAVAADGTQRWSILVDPCATVSANPAGDEIVVCGSTATATPRLPLPDQRGAPDRPMPSNPYMTGTGALGAASAPCATRSEGCTVGVDLFSGGTAFVRLVGKLINPESCCEDPGEATNIVGLIGDAGSAIGSIFKRKPDKRGRIPIPLD